MKNIDFQDIGLGILLSCIGINLIVNTMGDNSRKAECDKRGGVIRKVSDEWFPDRACIVPQVKP